MRRRIIIGIVLCFFFFFSSRRRHTRSLCDWSSDVCSSDLAVTRASRGGESQTLFSQTYGPAGHAQADQFTASEVHRSEERRVGKSVDLGGRCIIKEQKTQDK